MWGQPTSAAPGRAPASYAQPEAETTGPHRLDDELRGLSDTRSFGGNQERPGSVERRYADDDL